MTGRYKDTPMATTSFYRERAEQAQRDADAATLTNVRERHLVARDTWMEMADKAQDIIQTREKNEAEKLAAQGASALIAADANYA
jgi:hypothetical protein